MTTNLTRRTAMLGTVTLPAAMAPLGLARAAPENATDAVWAELKAAKAAYAEQTALYDGFEESLPVGRVPRWEDFEDKDEWVRSCDARGAERALYPANPHDISDEELDAFCKPINNAEDALLETPPATMTDLERKLIAILESDRGDDFAREDLEQLLADVRALGGRAA